MHQPIAEPNLRNSESRQNLSGTAELGDGQQGSTVSATQLPAQVPEDRSVIHCLVHLLREQLLCRTSNLSVPITLKTHQCL